MFFQCQFSQPKAFLEHYYYFGNTLRIFLESKNNILIIILRTISSRKINVKNVS